MSVAAVDGVRSSFAREHTKKRNVKDNDKFIDLPTNDDDEHEEPMIPSGGVKRDGMTLINIAAYSVGHVYNDFWATWWFMYLLYFLTYPVGLGAGKASYALLAGQIADGLATNIVGFFIDKTNTRIGKKKPWYIIGFIKPQFRSNLKNKSIKLI